MPAAVLCLNSEQSAAIAAANDVYGLADARGQTICVRRQETGQEAAQAVVAFTAEQWEAASHANGTVEVRSHDGKPLGYLVLNPHVNLFYSIRETELLLKRARESKPGRTLSEILGEALTRAGA
jgi:hypothetical protein